MDGGRMDESWALVDSDDHLDASADDDPSFGSLGVAQMAQHIIERVMATVVRINENAYSAASYLIEDCLNADNEKKYAEETKHLVAVMKMLKKRIMTLVAASKSGDDLKMLVEGLFRAAYGDGIVEKNYKVGDDSVQNATQRALQTHTALEFFYGIVLFLMREVKSQKWQIARKSTSGSPAPDARTTHVFVACTTLLLVRHVTKENIRYRIMLIRYMFEEFGSILQNQLPRSPDNVYYNLIRFLGEFNDPKYLCTGKLLGAGAAARVYLGYNAKTGQAVALKVMDTALLLGKNPKLKVYLDNELRILGSLNCDNVVRLYEVVREGSTLNVVLEYCGGGTLQDLIKERKLLPEKEALHWLRQLALGVKELRANNIVHRDLKPANLLLNTDRSCLKITDFGFARELGAGELATSMVGTPLYVAPEIILHGHETREYTEKADVWSVGVILFEMLTGVVPYDGENFPQLIKNLKKNVIADHPKFAGLSPGMQQFVSALLAKEYNLRMSWPEFFQHLSVDQRFCTNCVDADNKMKALVDRLKKKKAALKELKEKLGERENLLEQHIVKVQGEREEAVTRVRVLEGEVGAVKIENKALAERLQALEREEGVRRERAVVEEAERKVRKMQRRLEKEERDKKEKEDWERLQVQLREAEKRLREKEAELERVVKAKEAGDKEHEQRERERQEQEERERKEKEEREKKAEEERQRKEQERKAREEKERKEREAAEIKRVEEERARKAREEREEQLKKEREERERQLKEERERRERELQRSREEKERKEREEKARKAREEKERKEREEKERKEKAEQERQRKLREEKERKEREEKERKEREEKASKEREEKERKEREERERQEREKKEREREERRRKRLAEADARQHQIEQLEAQKADILMHIDIQLANELGEEQSKIDEERQLRVDEQNTLDHLFALEIDSDPTSENSAFRKKTEEVEARRRAWEAALRECAEKRKMWVRERRKEAKTLAREINVLRELDSSILVSDQEEEEEKKRSGEEKELQERLDAALAKELEDDERQQEANLERSILSLNCSSDGVCGGGNGTGNGNGKLCATIVINHMPHPVQFVLADRP